MTHPDDLATDINQFNRVMSGEIEAYTIDKRFIRKDSQVIYTTISVRALRRADGSVDCILALLQDITERKRAEQELEAARSEAVNEKNRLEAVMESLPVGVAIIDTHGGIVNSNSAYEQVWGRHLPPTSSVKDYAAYQAWWVDTGQLVQPEEWAAARAIQKGERVIGQLMEIAQFDGSRAFVHNSAAPSSTLRVKSQAAPWRSWTLPSAWKRKWHSRDLAMSWIFESKSERRKCRGPMKSFAPSRPG